VSFGFLRWRPGRSIGLTVALVALVWMASTAAVPPPNKPFAVTFFAPLTTPPPPGVPIRMPAGMTIPSFTVTIHNNTGTQQIGSADITVPETFRIASTPAPKSSRGGLLPPLGNKLRLRNAAVPPGESVTITLTLGVPCATTDPATYHWIVEPKQSNDFKGAGNDLTQPPPETLDNTVISRCALRFAAAGQPQDAVKNQQIRAEDFAPTSSALVAVEAVDGRSADLAQRLIGVPGPEITVAQGTPDAVKLDPPSTTVPAVAGIARFSGLSITAAGVYTLSAATTDTRFASSPASSSSFTIVDVREECAARCQAALGPATAPTTTITGATSTENGFIELSENLGPPPDCTDDFGYTPPDGSAWYEFNFTADRAKTIAINYTAEQMKSVANKGALEVCYASPRSFTGKSGTVAFDYDGNGSTEGFVGLLPECPRVLRDTDLCVLARDPLPGGGASISFFASRLGGDPRYH
jgi:hypothetical protein